LLADLPYAAGHYYQNDACRFGRASNYAVADFGRSIGLYRQMELQAGTQNTFDRNFLLFDRYPEPEQKIYVNLRYPFLGLESILIPRAANMSLSPPTRIPSLTVYQH
jgi:hypothetical protein